MKEQIIEEIDGKDIFRIEFVHLTNWHLSRIQYYFANNIEMNLKNFNNLNNTFN